MPSRIVRDSICTSPTLDLLSDGAERMFWRLVTHADDFGRFEADPRILLGKCFPMRIGVLKVDQVAKWFQEMVDADLARTYKTNGRQYGHFPTWDKYQRVRAKESRYPPPPDDTPQHEETSADEWDGMQTSADTCPQVADIGGQAQTSAPVVMGYGTGVWNEGMDKGEGGMGEGKPPRTPARRRHKTSCPENIQPMDTQQQYAKEHHLNLAEEVPHFLHHHRAKGSMFIDWHDGLWTWLHNSVKFGNGRARASPADPTYLAHQDALDAEEERSAAEKRRKQDEWLAQHNAEVNRDTAASQ